MPIIFLTAAERASVGDLYRLGAVDFLQKPLSPDILLAKVSVFIELFRRGERLRAQEVELLRQAQRQSELERHRFAEVLVGIVSHDLRSPLAALSASLQWLERQPADERTQQVVARAQGSAARMERMIEQLLDLTRVRLGSGIALTRARADLRQIVQRVVDEVRAANPERKISIEGDATLEGRWDADRLEQVVQNLVGNAVRHGSEGTPVTLRLTGTANEAQLSVHNLGPPIPAEFRTSLFDPFRRGSSGSGGLGLGLYIAQQIAIAHGGRIVASSDDRGTEFRVELPRWIGDPEH